MSEKNPFLIVGLGNPGPDYRHNRHNVGFMAIDALARALDIPIQRVELRALVGKGLLDGQRVILAKPQTFMNKSGQAVASLARFYKIPVDQILVVHDDLDLPFGNLRLRPEGGTGGHKGMDSIMNRLGTREFPRLRVGIGRPPGRMDPADFVLHDFDPPQQELLPQALDRAVQAIRAFVLEGVELAMTMFNERPAKDTHPGEDQD
ncbi:MAG TPA: aminoacyl-tRNA hydrolase [Brevefilum sp.]|nr:aminoacyl-tRNA hydrolase [Brevefilum sp.]HOR19419.1 aminoacyl-tRNA hydrolase [Brevefilum sp.]HPL69952.1 aminoacyl-tRNA hydrolase [Brevefilum sp.]